TSRYSSGQGQVIQLGYFALSVSPGQPENSITLGTPSFAANCTVFRLTSSFALARLPSGWRGLPWHESAEMRMPLSESFFWNSVLLRVSVRYSSLQWASPG